MKRMSLISMVGLTLALVVQAKPHLDIQPLGTTQDVKIAQKDSPEFEWKGEKLKVTVSELDDFLADETINSAYYDAAKYLIVGKNGYLLRSDGVHARTPVPWNGNQITDAWIFEEGGDTFLFTLRKGKRWVPPATKPAPPSKTGPVFRTGPALADRYAAVAEVYSQKDQKLIWSGTLDYAPSNIWPRTTSIKIKDGKLLARLYDGVVWFDSRTRTGGVADFPTFNMDTEWFGAGQIVELPNGELATGVASQVKGVDKVSFQLLVPFSKVPRQDIGSLATPLNFNLYNMRYVAGKDRHYMFLEFGDETAKDSQRYNIGVLGIGFDPLDPSESKKQTLYNTTLVRASVDSNLDYPTFRAFGVGGEEHILIFSASYSSDDRFFALRARDGGIMADPLPFQGSSAPKAQNQGYKLITDSNTGEVKFEVYYRNRTDRTKIDFATYQIVAP